MSGDREVGRAKTQCKLDGCGIVPMDEQYSFPQTLAATRRWQDQRTSPIMDCMEQKLSLAEELAHLRQLVKSLKAELGHSRRSRHYPG